MPFLRLHQWLYRHSGGWIGHRLLGVPTLLLTSVGRKSGQSRTSALVYADDGERWVVVPSNGGQDRPPAWYFNVRATPDVDVQIGRRRVPATARVLETDEPEHARLWALANRVNHGRFDGYQRRTARKIGLVTLTPRA